VTITQALSLCAVGILAGFVNAIAGGGTLLSFPALIYVGLPPTVANATSTIAMFLGTAGSIYGFRQQLAALKPLLWRLLPVSLLGGWLGSVLLTASSDQLFARLAPWLILFATLTFMAQGALRRLAFHHTAFWAAIGLQLLIAIYGGYFGAGIGILMLAAFSLLGLQDLNQSNALKNVLASAINCVATLWFVASGLIAWPQAAVMTAGTVAGYFLGARCAQRLPALWVRRAIIVVGLVVALALLIKA
jgi:uncharacterized membrane protein YfcA